MDLLGRYYTADAISNLLISNLQSKTPKKILDLGIGDASLTIAAHTKWGSAQFYATEIERNRAKRIEKKLSFIKVLNYDTLQPNLSSKLQIQYGSMDIAICNPPYIRVEDKNKYKSLFESIGCGKFNELKKITSEIVFFAHNLKLLKKSGELGIIVSDTLITGKEYKIFRETILENFSVRRIIQLPDNVFNKTEARTHIIFISKQKTQGLTCELFLSDSLGKLLKGIKVDEPNLSNRMDYLFYQNSNSSLVYNKTLKEIGATIKRGKFSYVDLRNGKLPYFHSVHFKDFDKKIIFEKYLSKKHFDYSVSKGDILMCRVGKRIVGRTAIVSKGSAIISDCIYKITVPFKFQKLVLESLTSVEGKIWLKAYAHGVCSQVISKSDLENFPLLIK